MSGSSNSSTGGIGFAGLLTIVFITLKLIHKIAWSWWWVLSPLWISAAFSLVILVLIGAIAGVAAVFADRGQVAEAVPVNTGDVIAVTLGSVGACMCAVWAYGTRKGYSLAIRWAPKPAPKKTPAKAAGGTR